jgi:two-component system LytT family response regulator
VSPDDRAADVLIVDDEPLGRRAVRALLEKTDEVATIREAAGGAEAVRMIGERKPDVVFLDIQMPRVDGFGVIEAVGAREMPPVVFVTAHDEHALRAFEAQAIDYLLKPIDPDRFRDAFARATRARSREELAELRESLAALRETLQRSGTPGERGAASLPAGDTRLRVRHDGRVTLVDPREIDWIESIGNYVTIHARGAALKHRATLTELATLLGGAFIRIRHATLVRAAAVRFCEPYGKGSFIVVLQDGTRLTSSRYYRDAVAALVGK